MTTHENFKRDARAELERHSRESNATYGTGEFPPEVYRFLDKTLDKFLDAVEEAVVADVINKSTPDNHQMRAVRAIRGAFKQFREGSNKADVIS